MFLTSYGVKNFIPTRVQFATVTNYGTLKCQRIMADGYETHALVEEVLCKATVQGSQKHN